MKTEQNFRQKTKDSKFLERRKAVAFAVFFPSKISENLETFVLLYFQRVKRCHHKSETEEVAKYLNVLTLFQLSFSRSLFSKDEMRQFGTAGTEGLKSFLSNLQYDI